MFKSTQPTSMKTSPLLGLVITLSLLSPTLRAEDKKPDSPAPAPPAATQAKAKVIESGKVDDLRANEQQTVTVRGKVTRTKEWDGNGNSTKAMNFIDLEGGYFSTVTFAADLDLFKPRPAVLYRDKTIEVTGTLETRNGRWQIKLNSPDQVKIITKEDKKEEKEEKKAAKAEAEKKEETKDGDATDDKADTKDGKKRVDSKKFFK